MRQILIASTSPVHNFSELDAFTAKLKEKLGDKAVLLLSGSLGAGKTKTVESLLRHMKFNSTSSPTFSLHQRYDLDKISVDHFDLYRVVNEDDLESSGFWDVFTQPRGWVIVEWPERIHIEDIPLSWKVIELKIQIQDDVRIFDLKVYAA